MSKFAGVKWELMPGQLKSNGVISEGAMRLKRFREGKGMTAYEFGLSILVSGRRITDLERGIRRITPYMAALIEREYGLSGKLLLE